MAFANLFYFTCNDRLTLVCVQGAKCVEMFSSNDAWAVDNDDAVLWFLLFVNMHAVLGILV